MDLPVIETNIRAASKRKPRKCSQGIGEKEPGLYSDMQPRKWQIAFYHIIKPMEWITALTALICLSAVGAFTRRWMILTPSNLPYSLAVFFFNFSPLLLFFRVSCCWCFELFSPFLKSGHQIISCIWAWFIYSLPEMPAEPVMSSMSLKSASCTPGCHPNSCCSWVKKENEKWLQVIALQIRMLHHTWFWGLTWHPLKLIILSRMHVIITSSKIGWKHWDNWL